MNRLRCLWTLDNQNSFFSALSILMQHLYLRLLSSFKWWTNSKTDNNVNTLESYNAAALQRQMCPLS